MANRTVKDARNVHGTNPQYLIEKIIRSRIYDSKYWKEQCFALTAELLVDKAMDIRFLGGVFGGNIKPTPFLCLTLKMLQIQPEKDIVVEFIKNEEFKYVRALGAFYLRLTGSSLDCYKYLEPLYNDNRKLRRQNRMGCYELVHMDEFIDDLLREERVCDIILPRIQRRIILEENNELEPKVSALDDDLDEEMPSDDDNLEEIAEALKVKEKEKKLETIKIRDSKRERSASRERQSEKAKESHKERGTERYRDYDRPRERDRDYERRDPPADHRYKDREIREKERDRQRRYDRERVDDRDRIRRYGDRDRDRERERDRDRDRRDREYDRDRDRDYDRRRR
ncbi:pre-mRNA-splicing factor 38 [Toxorhynchites rutilus septentrionalis]|uniref:pre-mRNA-splicing factor 38 n=1 Tax=Toxorhynchites rutilus septentrionalis TaxID=329112 RepID=UPI00247A2BAE|nr:pre-mRNA-splicing factor 38 [Toxorhynchites rutilus septentrionalis]